MTSRERAAWSWTEQLRSGGSTPWSAWLAEERAGDAAGPPAGWSPAGAAQLELVRRLAAAVGDGPSGPAFTRLADLVLSRSGPGRGLAEQPLASPGGGEVAPHRRFGAPPVDPADVPVDELVRLAVGTLTELLLAGPLVPEPATPRRRLLTRTPAFRLAGAPVTTSVVRRELSGSGHVEGGRLPRVLLLAEPLDAALAQVWSARVQRGAPVRWRGFVQRWAGRRDLPPSADLPALARLWAERVGPDRVHVVAPTGTPTGTAAEVLGLPLRPGTRPPAPARCRDLSPAAVDVARRVNGVLGVRTDPRRRVEAVRGLVDALDVATPGAARTGGLTVPAEHRDWCADRAEQVTDDLRAGGYPVHGRLEDLVPRFEGLPTSPPRAEVLAVALAACLRQASRDQEQVETR